MKDWSHTINPILIITAAVAMATPRLEDSFPSTKLRLGLIEIWDDLKLDGIDDQAHWAPIWTTRSSSSTTALSSY